MSTATHYPALDSDYTTRIPDAAMTSVRVGPPRLVTQPAASPARHTRRSGSDLLLRVIQLVLFVTLAGSAIHTAIHLSGTPAMSADPSGQARADYVLMLVQCAAALIAMLLPAIVHRRWAITVPSVMQIGYLLFLYAAIYLGEVRSFYYRFPFWDGILHFLSGIMLGTLGFFLIRRLNDGQRRRAALSPALVAFFAFCFAVACGATWEIYEFAIDGIFGTNMQKVITDTGQVLTGREALADTMSDLILATGAALIASIAGYLNLRGAENRPRNGHAHEPIPDVLRTQQTKSVPLASRCHG